MVVVMAPGASADDVARVVEKVENAGGRANVSQGVNRTVIGLVGDIEAFHGLDLRAMAGVAAVYRISDPYKLVSRQHHPERSTVWVGRGSARVPIGPATFTLLAGPCTVQSADQTLQAATMARAAGASILRGGAYRPRRAPYAVQGLGVGALRTLAAVGAELGLPVATEVVDARDAETAAAHADLLQVGAQNAQNFTLMEAVGQTGKPVLLERGVSSTIEEWLMAAEHIAERGNLDIVLCERGIRTFETATQHTLDLSAVPVVQAASHLPVVVDPSHAVGRPELVVPLSRAAIAVGADGLVVDVHPHPESAPCEGPQALLGTDLRAVAQAVRRVPPLLGRLPASPGYGDRVDPPR